VTTKKKLITIPTYNESETISDLIGKIFEVIPDVHILIVDDNSPDGTGDIVKGLSEKDNRLYCLHRPKKQGIGPAYIDGFKWAISRGYEKILEMDADFSHDPKYVPLLFESCDENDLVIGSRYVKEGGVENWGIARKFVSRFGSLYAKTILNLPVNDLTGGFKCFKRETLEKIELDHVFTRGYAFQIEMTYRAFKKNARIQEIPIIFTDRRVGKTKMTWDIFFEAIFAVLKMRLFLY